MAGGLLTSGTAEAGASDSMLANTCAGCHGTNGAAAGPAMPSIANMDAEIMVTFMKQYQSGERPSTIMTRIAKGYEEGELKQIAAYFAKTPWVATNNPTKAALVKKGAKLHKKEKCNKCHEENGRVQSGEDLNPRIAGQVPGYLHLMMKNYQTQEYPDQPKKMIKRLKKMSDQDLEALAHFYASQK
ncbi:MAG: c-type cytochrome [Magnetococcales bacterium]|nr:c-type cytochrome [Magnetococcales bacterium]